MAFVLQTFVWSLQLWTLCPQPCAVNRQLIQRQCFAVETNYIWHVDSYDKPYGICINGWIDLICDLWTENVVFWNLQTHFHHSDGDNRSGGQRYIAGANQRIESWWGASQRGNGVLDSFWVKWQTRGSLVAISWTNQIRKITQVKLTKIFCLCRLLLYSVKGFFWYNDFKRAWTHHLFLLGYCDFRQTDLLFS